MSASAHKPLRTAVIVLGLAMPVLLLGWNVHYRVAGGGISRSDFPIFYEAGRAVLEGHDIYKARHPQRGWLFVYPPIAAVGFAPLALLPLRAAAMVWYAAGIAALGWAFRRTVRICDEAVGQRVGHVVAAMYIANLLPAISCLQRGQISCLLLALMVEAMWQCGRRRPARCGAWIALGAALKVYPALLLLPLIVRRDLRAALSFLAASCVLWALVPLAVLGADRAAASSRAWLATVTPAPGHADTAYRHITEFSPTNQSLFAFFGRWLAAGESEAEPPFPLGMAALSRRGVTILALLASAAVLAALLTVSRAAGKRRGPSEAALWSLAIAATVLVPPIAWHHYYVAVSPLYSVAATLAVVRQPARNDRALAWVLLPAVACNWVHFATMIGRQMGLLLVGTLVLWLIVAARIRRLPD